MKMSAPKDVVQSLVDGNWYSPYDVLGWHPAQKDETGGWIRTYQPYAKSVQVLEKGGKRKWTAKKVNKAGFFEVNVPDAEPINYTYRITGEDDHTWETEDPYRFPLQIGDMDLYLHGEGTHYRTYKRMGAHAMTLNGVEGVHFAVWAPNACRVGVIGWFNRWDGRHHPMQNRGGSGLWELFIPNLKPGDLYKFEIKCANGFLAQKSDPYAFATELRPRTASVVWDVDAYEWNDAEWMAKRRETDWLHEPINIYEVHLGSWKRKGEHGDEWLTYRELADDLVSYVKDLGFTHIELLPISEHPFDGSWGYQTIGYYAPTSRFGNPDDLKYFIDRCHQEGIGVIVDWVPAHFPKDAHGLAYFDGSHLYEHSDPRKGEHMDWGTLIFNYGRNEVRSFLLSNAMFWADIYHVDGFRVDAVASMLYLDYSRKEGEWVPNEFGGRENLDAVAFLKKFNEIVHADYPGIITFAEESTAWPMVSRPTYLGGLGFGLKWNMGWMNDTLEYFHKDPIYRKYHHNDITFSLIYAFTENFILPFSHDEVVHGKGHMLDKMPGDQWQKFANLRALYAYMFAHPGKKLLFMGMEFGQWDEWNCYRSLDWHLTQWDPHHKLQNMIRDLNHLVRNTPSLYEEDFSWDGFEWIDFHDSDQSLISFVRKGKNPEDVVVCVFNFTPTPRHNYRVGVPVPGAYREIFNSDSEHYWGSNVGSAGVVHSDSVPWQDKQHSIMIKVPPLSGVYFRPDHLLSE